jgi:hypothetical protein
MTALLFINGLFVFKAATETYASRMVEKQTQTPTE